MGINLDAEKRGRPDASSGAIDRLTDLVGEMIYMWQDTPESADALARRVVLAVLSEPLIGKAVSEKDGANFTLVL